MPLSTAKPRPNGLTTDLTIIGTIISGKLAWLGRALKILLTLPILYYEWKCLT